MPDEVSRQTEALPLREGFTTGTAAAAAAHAAVIRLLGDKALDTVAVALPPFLETPALLPETDLRLSIPIVANGMEPGSNSAWAAVIKDGGDDPDATHGVSVIVHAATHPFPASAGAMHGPVSLASGLLPPGQGPVHLYSGAGIGLVTLPGLPVVPGEPAINPEPRKQITFAALEAATHYGYSGPLHLLISVPEGTERARKTLNARLGITGGISILGTRGTVRPYSHEAWKATISQGISVASSLGLDTLLFSTGRRSERLGFGLYPELAPQCGIQVADFAAFALREIAGCGFARIIWCCFPGKLLKLAQGLEWTHANSAEADIAMLAQYCAESGGSDALAAAVAALPTATGAFALMARTPAIHDAVLRRVGSRAFAVLQAWLARSGSCCASCCPGLTLCVFSMQETLLLRLP
ncbi:MAG: cobalt-precorrin-5B (C(1))-methyltransferase CbiD [Desulfovibrionaceae bacterium]|nr:cobalt-precorrin-5B (C(1))-methyltransferase CbiD [Desulfovibrionaceae bacterium]